MTDIETPRTAGVIPPPLFLIVAVLAAWQLSLHVPLGWMAQVPDAVRYAVGGFFLVFFLVMELASLTGFGRARTPAMPWKSTKALVTDGIYGLVRNPMYVGFILILLGLSFLRGWDWGLPLAPLLLGILHFAVVIREEVYLTTLFGEAYTDYCQRVRRYGLF